MTSSNLRVLVLLVLLAGSWIFMALHWQAGHGDRPTESEPDDQSATLGALTSLTAIGELPDEARFDATPDFVTTVAPPARGSEVFEAEGGVRYSLYQVEHDNQGATPRQYVRMVVEPVSTAGIDQTANITVVFNPAYEELVFHTLQVERDGEVSDRRSSTTIEFARRETRLERRMFDGRATAIIRFSDIRLGDRVEYAYTVSGRNPALPENESRQMRLGFGAPVEQMLVRSVWTADQAPHHRMLGPDAATDLNVETVGDRHIVQFGPVGTPTFNGERGAPAWIYQAPTLQLSDFASWDAVSSWSAPFYTVDSSPEILALAEQIRSEHTNRDARLVAALRFVQDEIRYLAISFGAGGYVPAAPTETLERRYGDCKAKTLLLISLLHALDIDADAALVHTTQGHGLMETLPRHTAFNHVIVRAFLDGEPYWIDGTRSEQGGRLDTLVQPDFGYALPISANGETPVRMTEPDTETAAITSHETLMIHSTEGDASIEYVIQASGAGADETRSRIARSGRADLQESLLDYFRARFDDVTIQTDLVVTDDRDANEIEARLLLSVGNVLRMHENGEDQQVSGRATLRIPTRSNTERNRRFALSLGQPLRQAAIVTLVVPDGMADWSIEPSSRLLETRGIEFSLSRDQTGNTTILSYDLNIDERVLSPDEAEAALDAAEQVRQMLRWSLVSP
ncbi:DUF3857 domain-containing protein [uncultured Maricaulis sp.]|uniref:DUF3857 domain-containing transglutaminase family protein n=1 Tax=uncultured Maricaulis sp. TaxID=174710 RepID=UPI00261A6CEB|nr:DUF3857 domain-containing protein [uncultured Maricaulis sp.]